MPSVFGKFSTAKNGPYTPKAKPMAKAKPVKANAGKVRDVNPGLPSVGRLGGFKPLGGGRIKTYYGA